jgi:hypothetical protein
MKYIDFLQNSEYSKYFGSFQSLNQDLMINNQYDKTLRNFSDSYLKYLSEFSEMNNYQVFYFLKYKNFFIL